MSTEHRNVQTNYITLVIAVVQLLVMIFYLAWKIPTKEDIQRIDKGMTEMRESVRDLNQNYIEHLSAHHIVVPRSD